MPPAVQDATPTDLPAVATTLARAFGDDPIFQILFGAPVPRPRAERFFRIMGGLAFGGAPGLVQRTPGDEGAAIWAPPGSWKTSTSDILRNGPGLLRCFGGRTFGNLRILQVLEDRHPTEPHWYLEFIGTDPAHQGKGIGTALLQPMVDRCDEEGVGAYLESSKVANVPFYERFGFGVTEVITHRAGVDQWLMWRDPR